MLYPELVRAKNSLELHGILLPAAAQGYEYGASNQHYLRLLDETDDLRAYIAAERTNVVYMWATAPASHKPRFIRFYVEMMSR
jgi:hypothetical protein